MPGGKRSVTNRQLKIIESIARVGFAIAWITSAKVPGRGDNAAAKKVCLVLRGDLTTHYVAC